MLENRLLPRAARQTASADGLEFVTVQLLEKVQADEQAGDEVIAAGGQAHAAALQFGYAFEQGRRGKLVAPRVESAPAKARSKPVRKYSSRAAIEKKGEAVRRGGLAQ